MKETWMRRTVLFLGGQTITLFGSALVQYAISWHITLITQSGAMMTISILCGFLPQVLISLFAGVWADRHNKKIIIMLSDGAIALSTGILAVLFMLGYQDIWLLFIISGIRSLGSGVQAPAVNAFLPELVPEGHLLKVNGLYSSVTSVNMLLAPLAAGGLYALTGLQLIFWVDVLTAAIGIFLLTLLKVDAPQKKEAGQQSMVKDMMSGLQFVNANKWLRQFLLFYIFYALMFGPVVFLTPLMVARSFGTEPWRLAVHEMVFSAGAIIGGILVGLWGGYKNKIYNVMAASMIFGLTTFIMGFSQTFWFYLAVMAPMGIAMPFINTNSIAILQTKVQATYQGRVFGLVSIIGASAMPLSMVVFGPIADFMRVETQLIITGALMTVIPLYMLRYKEMIKAGEPEG